MTITEDTAAETEPVDLTAWLHVILGAIETLDDDDLSDGDAALDTTRAALLVMRWIARDAIEQIEAAREVVTNSAETVADLYLD